jgi:hypothetical protein
MNIAKPHPNVSIRTNINLNFSADQWCLLTDKFPRTVIERVADYLNKRIMLNYNKGEPPETVRLSFESLASDFKVYGATSKDTKKVFDKLISEVYN